MGLRTTAERLRSAEAKAGRCVIAQAYRHLETLAPEDVEELRELMVDTVGTTGSFISRVLTARLADETVALPPEVLLSVAPGHCLIGSADRDASA